MINNFILRFISVGNIILYKCGVENGRNVNLEIFGNLVLFLS